MNRETQSRLLQYSVMAGAMGMVQNMQGQVIYTDIEPDILLYNEVNEAEGWGYVDLNNDDTIDVGVSLEIGYNCGYCPYWVDFQVNINPPNEAVVAFDSPCVLYTAYYDNTCYVPGKWLTDFLVEGEAIDPAGEFLNDANELLDFNCGIYGDVCSQGFFRFDYGPVDDQFIGIRLIETDTNYCWIRLRWEGEALYIKDFACNLNAGEGLIIDIPELPSTINDDLFTPGIFVVENGIQIESPIIPLNGIIQLFDLTGRLIISEKWDKKDHTISKPPSTGIYVLNLQDQTHIYSRKVSIIH